MRVLVLTDRQCNGSDVFGSDICTCRPYLIYGIEEAVKEAQRGGSGVVIYFRKEGRALGEVTKVSEGACICGGGVEAAWRQHGPQPGLTTLSIVRDLPVPHPGHPDNPPSFSLIADLWRHACSCIQCA